MGEGFKHFYSPNPMIFQKKHLVGVEVHEDIEMNFTKLKFRYWNELYEVEIFIFILKKLKKVLAWFFHFKCYGTSMCGGKKI